MMMMTLELSSIELSTIALIAKLANLSFSQGVFPSKYKFAIVTPLLKKTYSRRSKPGQLSFRILITFLRFLKSYSCPGFRHMCVLQITSARHSRHIGVITLLKRPCCIIRQYLPLLSDQGRPSLLVSLDLSAAFDTIDHHLLLDRLNESFGVSGTAHSWLRSYLSKRHQSVRAGQSESPRTHCPTGVPQGSVLVFTCYISPISSAFSSMRTTLKFT